METLHAVSRRDFLRAGGAVVVSFASGAVLPKLTSAQGSAPTADLGKPLDANEVDSFLAIHADGSVTLYTSRVDVGTGLRTAMSQIAAEELGVPIERFTVVEGDTALTPDHGGTGGSSGIPVGATRVRQAAATARQELLRLGAEQLKRPAAELTIRERSCAASDRGFRRKFRQAAWRKTTGPQDRCKGSFEGPHSIHDRGQTNFAFRC